MKLRCIHALLGFLVCARGTAAISCGDHHDADTCAECPQGFGPSWCEGDCTWLRGACKPIAALDVKVPRPRAPVRIQVIPARSSARGEVQSDALEHQRHPVEHKQVERLAEVSMPAGRREATNPNSSSACDTETATLNRTTSNDSMVTAANPAEDAAPSATEDLSPLAKSAELSYPMKTIPSNASSLAVDEELHTKEFLPSLNQSLHEMDTKQVLSPITELSSTRKDVPRLKETQIDVIISVIFMLPLGWFALRSWVSPHEQAVTDPKLDRPDGQ